MLLPLVLLLASTAVPPPAATVNGVALLAWEADRELAGSVTSATFHRRIPRERRLEMRQATLDALVMKEAKRQWAAVNDVAIDMARADTAFNGVRSRFTSEETYLAALAAKGISDADFRHAFTRDAAAAAVDEKIRGRAAAPTVAEVLAHYEGHRSDYTMPDSRHVVHALVYVSPSATPAERDQARETAAAIAAAARDGRPLGELATEAAKRVPPKYHDQIGDLGFVHRGTLKDGLNEPVFGAAIGAVVGPEASMYGWHVLHVLEERPGQVLPFAQVEAAIATSLLEQRQSEALTAFERELLATNPIELGGWVAQPE